ncbi:MAG: 6-phosphofructokinase [Parasporobacterium sp.]|nr:6-phosphofructokinase [Parasporobacterium sp.]
MESAVKRIGVLTSGGDAPGMNAAVRAVVRTAVAHNIEVVGIKRGWKGLIQGDIELMNLHSVAHILESGGTILYTARSDEFRTVEGRAKAYNICKLIGLDGLVAIGGDGTWAGALALASEHDISVVGIPATIDNDIGCSEYSIGFDTAANTAVSCIDHLRDTMQSHERCSVIEVMGHNAGDLAQYVALASGATDVIIPEKKWNPEEVINNIRNRRLAGFTHFMIIIAEGAGSSAELADYIHEKTGLTARVTVLGHVQRGGSPTARDRVMATRMGYWAVKILAEGKTNRVVVSKDHRITDMDMFEAINTKHEIYEADHIISRAMVGDLI